MTVQVLLQGNPPVGRPAVNSVQRGISPVVVVTRPDHEALGKATVTARFNIEQLVNHGVKGRPAHLPGVDPADASVKHSGCGRGRCQMGAYVRKAPRRGGVP